jgi:hypothetical protein
MIKKDEKEEKRKIALVLRKRKRREMVHEKEVHTPSIKNIHTHAHLDQGL